MKVITVAIQKGGTGKSTTALNLAAGLKLKGNRVLALDLDAQGNLSGTAAVDKEVVDKTILEVLAGKISIKDAVQQSSIGDVVPANGTLAGIDLVLKGPGSDHRLQEKLKQVENDYDYVVIDTPPALSILTVNALTACDLVVIPAQVDIYSLESINELSKTIEPIVQYNNPKLKIAGILFTRYSPRAVITRDLAELAEQYAQRLNTKIFKAKIREAITVKESQANCLSLFDYDKKAKVTQDYQAFIDEFLKDEE